MSRLCMDCQFFVPDGQKCKMTERPSPIDGTPLLTSALGERLATAWNNCGPDAKLYEAKE